MGQSVLVTICVLLVSVLGCQSLSKPKPTQAAPTWVSPPQSLAIMAADGHKVFGTPNNTARLEILGLRSGAGPQVLVIDNLTDKNMIQSALGDDWTVLRDERLPLAVATRLKSLGKLKFHPLPQPQAGILEARLDLGSGKKLIVLGFHNVGAEAEWSQRLKFATALKKLKRSAGPKDTVLALGFTQFTAAEEERESLIERNFMQDWIVAHRWNGTRATDPLNPLVLLSRDLYDGLNDWRALPESFRSVTPSAANFVVEIAPAKSL